MICKYCMLFIVMIIILYFIGKMIKKRDSVEGFTADAKPDVIAANIQKINDYLNDELIIAQYRNDYETNILALDSWTDLTMLHILARGNIGTTEYTAKTSTDIRSYNQLAEFKKNLNGTMTFLDNNKD
jgi:hypothetical protein